MLRVCVAPRFAQVGAQVKGNVSFVIFVGVLLLVIHSARLIVQCFPDCKWNCDTPTCPAVCEPQCEKPACELRCEKVRRLILFLVSCFSQMLSFRFCSSARLPATFAARSPAAKSAAHARTARLPAALSARTSACLPSARPSAPPPSPTAEYVIRHLVELFTCIDPCFVHN